MVIFEPNVQEKGTVQKQGKEKKSELIKAFDGVECAVIFTNGESFSYSSSNVHIE